MKSTTSPSKIDIKPKFLLLGTIGFFIGCTGGMASLIDANFESIGICFIVVGAIIIYIGLTGGMVDHVLRVGFLKADMRIKFMLLCSMGGLIGCAGGVIAFSKIKLQPIGYHLATTGMTVFLFGFIGALASHILIDE